MIYLALFLNNFACAQTLVDCICFLLIIFTLVSSKMRARNYKCSFEGCPTNFCNACKLLVRRYHEIPRPNDTKQSWMPICKLPKGTLENRRLYVCNSHFLPSDYSGSKQKLLRDDSVPRNINFCQHRHLSDVMKTKVSGKTK